jgi:hypothetical protein
LQDAMVRTSSESLGEDTGAWLEGWGGKK